MTPRDQGAGEQAPEERVRRLLADTGRSPAARLSPLSGGANNRVFRVDADAETVVAKAYKRPGADRRDRRLSEAVFSDIVAEAAPSQAPRLLATSQELETSLFSWIEGRVTADDEVSPTDVQAAARFFAALNGAELRARRGSAPQASEAAFLISDHQKIVAGRLEALQSAADAHPRPLQDVLAAMERIWDALSRRVTDVLARRPVLAAALHGDDRGLSPSDFGFHNALRRRDDSLVFLDFEYAGWDDPSRMAADFFAQPQKPAPAGCFDAFVETAFAPFGNSAMLADRARLLRPIYQAKWFCIVLGPFLPEALARRRFANPGLDVEALHDAQLAKARHILHRTEELGDGVH